MSGKIPGGLSEGKKPGDFDPKALAKGQKVEMEHTTDPAIAQEIARDHLTEDPAYYDKLEKIEGKKAGAVPAKVKDQVEALLKDYAGKEVPDDKVHAIAEQAGVSPHDLESYVYSLASKYIAKVAGWTMEHGMRDKQAAYTVFPQQLPGIGAKVSKVQVTAEVGDLYFDDGTWVPVHLSKTAAQRVASRYLVARSDLKEIRTLTKVVNTFMTVVRDAFHYIDNAPDDPAQIDWYQELSHQLDEIMIDAKVFSDQIPRKIQDVKRKLHDKWKLEQEERSFRSAAVQPKPATPAQIQYARHLLKQQGVPEPEGFETIDQLAISDLISGLKAKRGRPWWYGNGTFGGFRK